MKYVIHLVDFRHWDAYRSFAFHPFTDGGYRDKYIRACREMFSLIYRQGEHEFNDYFRLE